MQRPLWLRALARVMMLCAAFHLVWLAGAAVITGKWYLIGSLASVLDMQMVIPGADTSGVAAIASGMVAIILYVMCYLWAKHDTASW